MINITGLVEKNRVCIFFLNLFHGGLPFFIVAKVHKNH